MEIAYFYRTLGSRIKSLRRNLPLTQEQLAQQVGMSRASLANIEAGRQQGLAHHLIALASALQLESPAQLLLQEHPLRRSAGLEHQLPLSAEGLTNRQRL